EPNRSPGMDLTEIAQHSQYQRSKCTAAIPPELTGCLQDLFLVPGESLRLQHDLVLARVDSENRHGRPPGLAKVNNAGGIVAVPSQIGTGSRRCIPFQDEGNEKALLPCSVQAKVTLDSSPDAVDMVGGVAARIVLLVEELDEEGRALHAVGVL